MRECVREGRHERFNVHVCVSPHVIARDGENADPINSSSLGTGLLVFLGEFANIGYVPKITHA